MDSMEVSLGPTAPGSFFGTLETNDEPKRSKFLAILPVCIVIMAAVAFPGLWFKADKESALGSATNEFTFAPSQPVPLVEPQPSFSDPLVPAPPPPRLQPAAPPPDHTTPVNNPALSTQLAVVPSFIHPWARGSMVRLRARGSPCPSALGSGLYGLWLVGLQVHFSSRSVFFASSRSRNV
jgi:hypothetical protein